MTFRHAHVVAMGPIVDPHRPQAKVPLDVRGMFGIGDCIFQRAVLRELMKKHDSIILDSYYRDMFWDLIRDGLKINLVKDRGRIRDSDNRSIIAGAIPPLARRKIEEIRLTYDRNSIHQHGSILAAMFASANLNIPKRPDFSLPVPAEWVARWRLYFKQECVKRKIKVTKPILVYRPIILNTKWTAPARAPDPHAYNEIYKTIRKQFFVISIADLKDTASGEKEWVVGHYPDVDFDLNSGQLDFQTMCGLFKDADMVFGNPGFVPVLAQAVGTPNIIVYGGNETFATTNSVGKHLAPTCAIDIDKPCPCHLQNHQCKKTITLPPAKAKVQEFTKTVLDGKSKVEQAPPRVLIFGTTYVDTPERAELTQLWCELHSKLNPGCDILLVDSASPALPAIKKGVMVHRFDDNVGHLSRNGPGGASSSGRDGWGRAFSKGLDIGCAIGNPTHGLPQGGYDYVVHIEGDSLFKHPVLPIIERMRKEDIKCLSVPVKGTKRLETSWVETGLMFFDTEWLIRSKFTKNYDWANRKATPTPEKVIYSMLGELGDQFRLESWGALRGDKNQINADNIHNLDWVTHLRNKVGLDDLKLFRKYRDAVLNGYKPPTADDVLPHGSVVTSNRSGGTVETPPTPIPSPVVMPGWKELSDSEKVKLNFGCGTNKLAGWQNFDKEVNIQRRLPFNNDYADFIFAEHVVEHIPYYSAISFLKECFRILKPNGVLRITTPSIEFLQQRGDDSYFRWVHEQKWAPTADRRGAMHAILYCHGHQTAWTSSLLMSTMFFCGFDQTKVCEVGKSAHSALTGVEGHDKVIGQHFNWIESLVVEGMKHETL